MNRRESVPRKPSNSAKDSREEELSFFRDIQKREKHEIASLLQPVSNEFEANANYGLYRMESARRGPALEFLAESGKNDYNWLKTPPATPLFPSLEMETNAPEMVIHREIPIIQPLSRFAANSEVVKTTTTATNRRPISPNPKPKIPQSHKTPNQRPTISSTDKKNMKTASIINPKTNPSDTHQSTISLTDKKSAKTTNVLDLNTNGSNTLKFISRRGRQPNFLTSNLSKSMGMDSNPKTNTKPQTQSRGLSPSPRPIIPAQIQGVLSDETPPNLRTDRSTSATRRQSCSPTPSVTRGRKVDINQKVHQTNKGQVLGSRMVDKFMNARMSTGANVKMNSSINEISGFGRLISRSSLDMALKHMDFQKDSIKSRTHGAVTGRK